MRPSRSAGRRWAFTGLGAAMLLIVLLPALVVGGDWATPGRVTSRGGSRLDSLHQLAASADALHLTHPRLGRGRRVDRVVYQRSGDGGRRWTREHALFSTTRRYRSVVPNLAIAARGSLVVVAWRAKGPAGTTLFARTSRDGGESFGRRVVMTATKGRSGIGVPAVAVGSEVIAVAWTSRAKGIVKVRLSRDEGHSFGPTRSLGRTGLSIECRKQVSDGLVGIAAAGPRLHLAWSVARKGDCLADRIMLRTSVRKGTDWSKSRTLTRRRSYGWPELEARGRVVLATAQLPTGGLVVVRSADNGRRWRELALKPHKGRILSAGDVLLDGRGEAWITYVDGRVRDGKLVGTRVVARRSRDGGRRFGPVKEVLAAARLLRQAPNLAMLGKRPTIVLQSGGIDGHAYDIVATRWR